jgi:hypothetical protein
MANPSLPRIALRAVALVTGAGAIFLAYRGFEGAWYGNDAMWAIPVALALITLGALLWDEELGAKRAEDARTEIERQKQVNILDQKPHGGRRNDKTI